MRYIQLNLRLPQDLLELFDEHAARAGVSRSWLIRDLMSGYCDYRVPDPPPKPPGEPKARKPRVKPEPDEMVMPVRRKASGPPLVMPEKVTPLFPPRGEPEPMPERGKQSPFRGPVTRPCDHPKGMRRVLTYGTWCSVCSKKLS